MFMDEDLVEAILVGLHEHGGSGEGLELRSFLESKGIKVKKAKISRLVSDLKSQSLIRASVIGDDIYAEILPEGILFLEENIYLGGK